MSERKITTLLLIGFGAAVMSILEIIHVILDYGQAIICGLGIVAALLIWIIFYLDDLKNNQ